MVYTGFPIQFILFSNCAMRYMMFSFSLVSNCFLISCKFSSLKLKNCLSNRFPMQNFDEGYLQHRAFLLLTLHMVPPFAVSMGRPIFNSKALRNPLCFPGFLVFHGYSCGILSSNKCYLYRPFSVQHGSLVKAKLKIIIFSLSFCHVNVL